MKHSELLIALAVNLSFAVSIAQSQDAEKETVVVHRQRAYFSDFETLEVPQAELVLDLSVSVSLWNSFAIRGFVDDENRPNNYLVNGFNAGGRFDTYRLGADWTAPLTTDALAIRLVGFYDDTEGYRDTIEATKDAFPRQSLTTLTTTPELPAS